LLIRLAAPGCGLDLVIWTSGLLGCGGFMSAALPSFVPPHSDSPVQVSVSHSLTLIGALGFLIGALLILAE